MEVCFSRRQVIQKLTLWLVGTIGHPTDPLANRCSDGPLGIAPPASSFVPSEVEPETTDRIALTEFRPPSRPEYPPQDVPGCTEEVTVDAGGSLQGSNPYSFAEGHHEDVDFLELGGASGKTRSHYVPCFA